MDRIGERRVADAKRRLVRRVGGELRQMREDAGVSQAAVARSAGINQPYLSRIEAGNAEPSLEVLLRLGLALGADLGVRYFVNTGPRIRDHLSSAMGTEIAAVLHPRWRMTAEVAVYRPVRGVIDVVLEERDGVVTVETEIHSQLHRIEQQVRWQGQKADGLALLPDQEGRRVSRLLVLRNTQGNRDAVRAARGILASVYPARTADAVASLRGDAPWPGPAIAWMNVEGGRARLLDRPPRGVMLGR
jgi:transcriptional regulator with XRE-family HTH domain